MTGARTFEELRIWQEARVLVKRVYETVGPGTPAERDWGFRDQIQRASISVMNNIAEGFERTSKADFARLLDVAKGSAGEVRSLLYVAEDLCYMKPGRAQELRDAAQTISKGTSALTSHLRKSERDSE